MNDEALYEPRPDKPVAPLPSGEFVAAAGNKDEK